MIMTSWSSVNGHAVSRMKAPDTPSCVATGATAGAPLALEGRRVLVVEDSWHIAVALKSLLENTGMVVIGPVGRRSEAEALLAAGAEPDIAVMDVNLHGEMAVDLVERLIARDVPVIVVSGYETVEALKGKVSAFLSKPVRSRVLITAIRKALERVAR